MFLITGITGRVGGAAARVLLSQGKAVRGFARDPDKVRLDGAELIRGDLADPDALAAGLAGVEAAFVMSPPMVSPGADYAEARAFARTFRAAIDKARPPRVVVLSSIGSEKTSGLGLITATHILEQALAGLPAVAFVRAGGFLENFAFSLATAATTGILDTFLTPTDRPFAMVATADIGAEVARLLASPWTGTRVIELGTPYSVDQIAAAMTDATGRPVVARSIPRERWSAVLERMGLPAGGTAAYEEMEDSFNAGWITFGTPGAERVAATTTPATLFARLHRRA
jgi:uncharacterized protein YbjT (DUF2867 family)